MFISNDISKIFDELIKDIEEIKEYTIEKIQNLEQSTNLKKIQYFKPLWLENLKIQKNIDNSWFNHQPYLRLSFNRECFDYLLKNHIDLFKDLRYKKNWKNIKLCINEDNENKLENLFKIIEVIYEYDLKTHQENIKKVNDNKKLIEQIFNILEQVGIKTTYYGYKTSRSKKETKLLYNFPQEIGSQIPTNYPENKLEKLKEDKINIIKRLFNEEIEKIKEERRKKEEEQKQKERNKKLALLLAKYDLDLDNDWNDVLSKILEKDKYLNLAYHLELNREDWSDGYWYAEFGLDNFKIENELDQKIYNDISSYWEDFCDGRVFRDCEYNYSVLYNMVKQNNPELYKDFEVVIENMDE